MDTLEHLQLTWYIILGIIFIIFSILDGFDLGIGSLLPFLSQDDNDTKKLFTMIGPVWDGNEVWLLLGGGALFAAFPNAYATVFSGFYLAFMLILFGLIFRAVSLEFWMLEEKRKSIWKWSFVIGSIIPPLLMGIGLGNVLYGIPLDDKMEFTGSFFTLIRPYPLIIGTLGLSAMMMQGCTFAFLKGDGTLEDTSRTVLSKVWMVTLILFILSALGTLIFMPENFSKPLAWFFATAYIISMALIKTLINGTKKALVFILSSLSMAFLWGIAASIHYPNLVSSINGKELSLTIFNSSSSALSLKILLIIAFIGMPLVLAYKFYIYWVFRKS